jgi:hypothetical protein
MKPAHQLKVLLPATRPSALESRGVTSSGAAPRRGAIGTKSAIPENSWRTASNEHVPVDTPIARG